MPRARSPEIARQSRASSRLGCLRQDLHQRLEDTQQLLSRDAYAGVPDRDANSVHAHRTVR